MRGGGNSGAWLCPSCGSRAEHDTGRVLFEALVVIFRGVSSLVGVK